MDRRRRLQSPRPVTGVAAGAERGRRDGTVRQIESATREICPVRGRNPQPDCIRMKPKAEVGPVTGVGGVHSSDEAANPRGAKELWLFHAWNEEKYGGD